MRMQLYLVRWHNDRVSLVSARNQKELFRHVDTFGDPALCTFQMFNEPLHLVFKPEHSPCEKSFFETAKEWPVPDTGSEVIESMASLFNSGMMSDVTIMIGEAAIKCHKVILAQRCEFFRAMFNSGMKEAQTETVTLDSYPYIVIFEILRFIYTGTFEMPSVDVLSSVYGESSEASKSESLTKTHKLQRDFLTELVLAADFFSLPSLTKLAGQNLSDFCYKLEGALHLFNLWSQLKMKEFLHTAAVRARSVIQWADVEETHPKQFKDLPSELSDFIREMNKHDKNASRSSSWTEQKFLNLLMSKDPDLLESVDRLIEQGLVLHEINTLHLICNSWVYNRTAEKEKLWLSLLHKCLASGCSVNSLDPLKDSPLHSAAACFALPLVEKLLEAGADPLARNYKGNTPLMEAQEALDVEAGLSCLIEDNSSKTQELLQEHAESCLKICELLNMTSNTRPENLTKRSVDYEQNIASEISLNPDFVESLNYESELAISLKFELCNAVNEVEFHNTLFEFAFPNADRILLHRNAAQVAGHRTPNEKTFQDGLKRDIYLAQTGRGCGRRLVKYEQDIT